MALRALTIGDTSYAGEPAPLLLGPKEFVEKMKKLLKGDRREQTGLRKAKEGSVNWEQITVAVSELWGARLGNAPSRLWKWRPSGSACVQYSAVTMAIQRIAKQLKSNRLLAKKIKRLESMLLVLVDCAEKPRAPPR
jgi:hypothetical protein